MLFLLVQLVHLVLLFALSIIVMPNFVVSFISITLSILTAIISYTIVGSIMHLGYVYFWKASPKKACYLLAFIFTTVCSIQTIRLYINDNGTILTSINQLVLLQASVLGVMLLLTSKISYFTIILKENKPQLGIKVNSYL